jgi:hypothetical protein
MASSPPPLPEVVALGLAELSSRCPAANALIRSQTRHYGMQCDTFRQAMSSCRCVVPSRRVIRGRDSRVLKGAHLNKCLDRIVRRLDHAFTNRGVWYHAYSAMRAASPWGITV